MCMCNIIVIYTIEHHTSNTSQPSNAPNINSKAKPILIKHKPEQNPNANIPSPTPTGLPTIKT
jgi:hypothetical protein